ncbi:MAG: phasin family protein [Pseudomonadota bacterium]
MTISTGQFLETNKTNLQALESMTNQALAGIEKLVELNLATSKAILGESFSHAQAVLCAKDPQEFLALQSDYLKPLTEQSATYAQQVQAILTESSAEITKTVEAKTAEAQKTFGGVLENLSKNVPAGSETAVAAFKNAMTASQSAFESVQNEAKKAVETAQLNFTAATTQNAEAIKKTSKAA